jgi:selenide,water dikinase
MKDTELQQDLLLIGGGHAHAIVLRILAAHHASRYRITLISSAALTPYSGMLPGLIAGHYAFDDAHINLENLCLAAGVHFIEDTVVALDLERQQVHCRQHSPFSYRVLSIDIGSSPDIQSIPGAAEFARPLKPVDQFLAYWQDLQTRLQDVSGKKPVHIALVGAGASGVEVALAMQYRLQQQAPDSRPVFHVISPGNEILQSHHDRVRKRYQAVLDRRGIQLHFGFRVTRVEAACLYDESDALNTRSLPCDEIIWAISAAAPVWPARSGLACSDKGFIQVNACLQSVSHANVFAAGDIADVLEHPRPKAGVFAVRQGPPLTENLLHALAHESLRPFVPQQNFLSLLSTGNQYAIASRGRWAWAGKWVWRWKDYIDRKFMRSLNAADPEAK